MKCANYMDFEAIRATVKARHERWGPRDEPMLYDLSDVNIIRLCTVCDFGGTGSLGFDRLVRAFGGDTVKLQDTVKKLTGEPLKRVCFKELVETAKSQT